MQKQLDTRERIIVESIQCFFEMEYEKVTLNEIAKRVDVTKGGIYHYFDSKDELFIQALRYTFKDIAGIPVRSLDNHLSFQQQLAAFFDFEPIIKTFVDLGHDKKNDDAMLQLMYLMFMAFKKNPDIKNEIKLVYREMTKVLDKCIQKAQESGEIRKDLHSYSLALQICTIFEGLTMYFAIDSDMEPQKIGKNLYENLWAQIRV